MREFASERSAFDDSLPEALKSLVGSGTRGQRVNTVRLNVDILIHRPIQDVFSFLVHWENASLWNSAVRKVTKTSDGPVGVDTEYWMSRELPQGPVENTFKVVEYEPNRRYSIQTTSGPTPFLYRYEFDQEGSDTRISLSGEGKIGGIADMLSPIASIAVKRGVEANLHTLRDLLESRT